MAGNGHKKEQRQQERVGPSVDTGKSSRVSNAAGRIGSSSLHVEQRSSSSGTKQKQRASAAGRSNNPVPARSSQGGRQSPKRGAANRAKPAPAPVAPPADTLFINKMRDKWTSMEPHHQQRFFGILLLGLSILLFLALTAWRSALLFKPLADFFFNFFGWSAYLLALGLIAFAVAHLIEGIRNIRFIRWSLVIGLLVLLMLLLTESQMWQGKTPTSIVGGLLASPLLEWGFPAHVLILGLFVIVACITFRITFGHVAAAVRFVSLVFVDKRNGSSSINAGGLSPFLGQRPQYSRYMGQAALASNPAPGASPARKGARGNNLLDDQDDDDEDEETVIDFEDDFASEDDPLNDINIHRQQPGSVPRGARPIQPFNREEHKAAVQGARQQPLPFDSMKRPSHADEVDMDDEMDEMEPLAPKPPRAQSPQSRQPKVITRAAKLEAESPWKLPESAILNSPEEVKLHMMGDDTGTLAKTIQDTLRSFRVEAEVRPEDISIGPTVIRFGIRPTGKPAMKEDEKGRLVPIKDAAGNIVYETRTRVSRIMALQNDLALVLESKTIRMEAPVPGRPYVGVEIPNKNSRLVTLREVLESKEYQAAKARSKLTVALGKDVAGAVRVGDLAKMPHLLIAGATGAGKCLAYNEPVFLADGRIVKAQDLIGKNEHIIGVTDTQTMQQTLTLATFTDNGVQEVFEIELDNGLVLRRTGEHPLWAAMLDENQYVGRQPDGKASRRTRAINAGWVRAKDLRVCGNRPNFEGHIILCPLTLSQKGTITKSDADVILCAALLAEGGLSSVSNSGTPGGYKGPPRFTNADAPIVNLVVSAAMAYGCQLVPTPCKAGKDIQFYISQIGGGGRNTRNSIAQLVCDWGINCLATQKCIPEWVFQLPDEQIAMFLRVFVDCAGWISVRGHRSSVSLCLANATLVQQIGQLALRLGITGTYTYKKNGFAGAWTWSTTMVKEWHERIGSLIKAEKLSDAIIEQAQSPEGAATVWNVWRRAYPLPEQEFAVCPPGYEWRKIVAIRRTTAPTVNIEVHSDNHAFVGYVVEHNSVMINTIIASALTQATPDDVRMLMVDPKMVELSMYNGIPHLLSPVVTEVERVVGLLKIAIGEMEKRYRLFSQLGVRNLDGYRRMRAERMTQGDSSLKNLPAIVIIIDELADLMMAAPEEVEGLICRLAQLARATGIHLVVATQRPSVDVITGLIKANIPTRISFMVSSAVDSRTIIDMGGAERLLGRGDMLYLPADAGKPERIQGAFVADDEADRLVTYWRQQAADHAAAVAVVEGKAQDGMVQPAVEPGWEVSEHVSDEFELEDDLLEQAEQVVQEYERASISLLQRRLRIGYSRAARLIDLLEERGVISRAEPGARSREVFDKRPTNHGYGEGRTMADEAADIIAEEKMREEFLKKQKSKEENGES